MAKSHGYNKEYDYALFSDDFGIKNENKRIPKEGLYEKRDKPLEIFLENEKYVEMINGLSSLGSSLTKLYLHPLSLKEDPRLFVKDKVYVFNKDKKSEYFKGEILKIYSFQNYEEFLTRIEQIKESWLETFSFSYNLEDILEVSKDGYFLLIGLYGLDAFSIYDSTFELGDIVIHVSYFEADGIIYALFSEIGICVEFHNGGWIDASMSEDAIRRYPRISEEDALKRTGGTHPRAYLDKAD